MKALKTAVIGCGPRSADHFRAAREGGALEVGWACDLREERARASAEQWGVRPVHDATELFADREVEAVCIVTDVGNHLALAQRAVEAGKHVIVEKPLGDEAAAARAFVALAARSDRVVQVSFQLRFQPQLAVMRQAAERLDPVQIFWGRSRGMMKPQFLNPSPFCGIMDVCAHDFDVIAWLMGRNPEAVTAALRRDTFTAGTGAVDTLSVLLDFGDGRSATVVSSLGAPEIGGKCDLAGRSGNLSLNTAGALSGVTFAPGEPGGAKQSLTFEIPTGINPDVELQKAFCAEVRTGRRSPAARPLDGLNSLLVTLACLKSAQEKRRVELSEIA